MRISDWSSDVCSSDLQFDATNAKRVTDAINAAIPNSASMIDGASIAIRASGNGDERMRLMSKIDRKSVVSGKSVSVRVDLGGRRSIKKTKKTKLQRCVTMYGTISQQINNCSNV